ncbi:MAG: hypothetical protein JNM67_04890 [Bacteroidetes bacterium]|nr:hypothetical protein [Bacteroidota bacterium]
MTANIKFYSLFSIVAVCSFFSCKSADKKEEAVNEVDDTAKSIMVVDEATVEQLLDKSKASDTIQMYSAQPFLFYKTGYLFDSKVRHSLVLSCLSEDQYKVRIYQVNDTSWSLVDVVGPLKANLAAFYIESKDYNFDSEADIYIQSDYSNNYPISTGHIILVDPITKKMSLCPNSDQYGNPYADAGNKTLRSESKYKGTVKPGEEKIVVKRSKWVKDHFETIDSTIELVTAARE